MTSENNLEKRLEDLRRAIGSDGSLVENVMGRIDAIPAPGAHKVEKARTKIVVRRLVMNRFSKFAAAAAVIVAAVLSVTFLGKLTAPAYALEQTVEAFKNVRFLHLIRRDVAGRIEDERWIEIGAHGRQVRYRQDTPPNFLAIEDGQTTAEYHKDKNTVVLYSNKDKQYQWVGNLGLFLENLRQEGRIIEENADYGGRVAHRVLWPMMNAECYVDPQTKLPIAIGRTELSYELPPTGTFEIIVPEDYVVLDKRPGAPEAPEPQWLDDQRIADEYFRQARYALKSGSYKKAAELFEYVVEKQPGRNWAWFWLGSSYYGLGEYDSAIRSYSKVLEMMSDQPYCLYSRGLTYAQNGMEEPARTDLAKALPWMIQALRKPTAAAMFEYADDPTLRDGEIRPTDRQIVARMINRLRVITGQNFGYDPEATPEQNEKAVALWEQWFNDSGEIKLAPDAELVAVPDIQE